MCWGLGKLESLALRAFQSEVSAPRTRMPVDKVFKERQRPWTTEAEQRHMREG